VRLFQAVPFFGVAPIDSTYSDEVVVRFTPPQYDRVLDTEHEGPAGIIWFDVEICHSWDRVPSDVSTDRCSVWKLLPVQPFSWAGLQRDKGCLRFMVSLGLKYVQGKGQVTGKFRDDAFHMEFMQSSVPFVV
jgi:hypothetical protein